MPDWLSDEALVLLSPLRGFERLQTQARPLWPGLMVRAAVFFAALGAALSFTTAGRLVAAHVLLAPLGWAFLPLAQLAAVAVCVRVSARRPRLWSAWELYLVGNAPLYALACSCAALVVLSPDPAAVWTWLFDTRLLALPVLATLVGSWLTSLGFHRGCLGASWPRALGLLALEWAVKIAVVLVWYQLIDNLLPQALGERGRAS